MNFDQIDYHAKVFVHGLRDAVVSAGHHLEGKKVLDQGVWHPRFMAHPWVISAEREGWGKDLRQHVVRCVRSRMMGNTPYADIDSLMPDGETAGYWRAQAKGHAEAAVLRAAHPDPRMQGKGGMRRIGVSARGLTETSRRMSGDRDS